MFIRLVTITGTTKVDEGIEYVRGTALPVIRQQNGYRGLSLSLDRSTNTISILSVWATESDRDASESTSSKMRAEGNAITGGALLVENLEEVARELVNPPKAGCALMVTPYTIEPAAVDDAIEFFNKDIAPLIKAVPSFCALRNMVNRSTGAGYVGTIWESKAAMEAQRELAQERRATASERGITFGPIGYREIVLVDNP